MDKLEIILFKGGHAELWNCTHNTLLGAGEINTEVGEFRYNAFIDLAVGFMIRFRDYDRDNPIEEGIVELKDKVCSEI